MKRKIAISICALLGVVAGYFSAPVAAMWYLQSTQRELFGASVLFLVESFIACNPHHEPPSERIKELSKDLAILQRWQTQNPGSRMLSQDIGLTYARLSGLELEMGHSTQANEDIKHSQEELKRLGWKDVSPSHLSALVTQLESEYKQPDQTDKTTAAVR
jgi:hypothetical protein